MGTLFIFYAMLLVAAPWVVIILAPFALLFAGFSAMCWALVLASDKLFSVLEEDTSTRLRALIVDDQPSSLLIMRDVLKDLNIDYTIIEDGHDVARELNENRYNFIVLDYDMPGVSGPQALAMADEQLNAVGSITVLGYSAVKEERWDVPQLKHFKFARALSKSALPSRLKTEIEGIFVEPTLEAV